MKRYRLQGKKQRKTNNWVEIPLFLADRVMQGDERAIQEIVTLFEPMVCKAARRKYISSNGNISYHVDPFIKGYIEGRLMEALVWFPYR